MQARCNGYRRVGPAFSSQEARKKSVLISKVNALSGPPLKSVTITMSNERGMCHLVEPFKVRLASRSLNRDGLNCSRDARAWVGSLNTDQHREVPRKEERRDGPATIIDDRHRPWSKTIHRASEPATQTRRTYAIRRRYNWTHFTGASQACRISLLYA